MLRGTFLGIETAKKGVLAARGGLDTTGHNISNSSTEGYSRQLVKLQASFPLAFPGPFVTLRPGTVGTGVEIQSIERVRSAFIESQIHREGGDKTQYEVMNNVFTRVEDIIGEPGEYSINSLMEQFFNAWEDLSNNPESTSARTNLREATIAFTDQVNEINFKLDQEIQNLNTEVGDRIARLNALTVQVAEVNKQISQLESGGADSQIKANDLKDRRDNFIEEISQLINADVIMQDNGQVTVLVSGHPIVSGQYAHEIGFEPNAEDPLRPGILYVKSRLPVTIKSGELNGLIRMRDEEIPTVREGLATLITTFTNRVNEIHLEGYGLDGYKGRSFFTDVETRRFEGSTVLPADITEETTLEELGITSGTFFIQGQQIIIEPGEVKPGTSITLSRLFERIERATVDIRMSIDSSLGFNRLVISQYNPIQRDTELTLDSGSSNIYQIFGIDKTKVIEIDLEPPYQNSLFNFSLNSTIKHSLDAIAAAGDDGLGFPGPGDNRTALTIGDLKNDNTAILNTTFSEFYQSEIARLGSAAQTVKRTFLSQELVVEQLENRRQEISGVNLDEEAINLIRFQRAFEASSRAITVLDQVLDQIINRMGIVGR